MIPTFLKRFIKRILVKIRQRSANKKYENAIKQLSSDELHIFQTIIDIAKKNKSEIRFDPRSYEILIVLPQMLVTLNHETISIQNTNGFITKRFPENAYKYLVNLIEIEAHRERRRLKFEVKHRIHDFLNNIEH